MKLSYKWLKEFVSLDGISPEQLAEKMTFAGLEVEGIEPMASGEKLCIGEVLECYPHPDSDHLHVTKTKADNGQVYQIVCGAPNCKKGLKVIVALPHAKLPGGTIDPRVVRGVESNGMLCSLLELGVDKHSLTEYQLAGIEELPQDAPVGETKVLEYLGLDDTVLDVSLTPNRADCLSMWNMAKEVGAILHRPVKWPDYAGASNVGEKTTFKVTSQTKNCPRFYGKVVNHVEIGPSPMWMQQYLHASGVKSINNVVDISNFVMLETGQPLHYYDLAKLPAHEITVVDNLAIPMTALDGETYQTEPGDLLITTGGEPTGLAGIMGGEESMIDENTKGIFIESALFSQVQIRRTSIRLNRVTEAAQRFTKGLEPLSQIKAMDRSVQLLTKYAGASGYEETILTGEDKYQPVTITESLSHCNRLLGTKYSMEEVVGVLKDLDFNPEVKGEDILCHIPSYRVDMAVQADVDEEVIRLLGYDSLQSTLPWMEPTVGKLSDAQALRRSTRSLLVGMNLHEMVTYTLVSEAFTKDAYHPVGEPVALAMPMSEARKYVRTSLMNSVLESVQYNEAHQNTNLGYYEISTVYGVGVQEERLAIALDGNLREDRLHKQVTPGDFYTMKGILETLLKRNGFQGSRIKIQPNQKDIIHFHPYRSAELWLDNQFLGVFGEVHPTMASSFDCKKVVYAEISLDVLLATKTGKVRFMAIDKYPSVSRDIALVVKKDVPAQQILDVIHKAGGKLLRSTEIFDVYEGEHVAEGMKSIALRILCQASDHTLKEEEVTAVYDKVLAQLEQQLHAQLRS